MHLRRIAQRCLSVICPCGGDIRCAGSGLGEGVWPEQHGADGLGRALLGTRLEAALRLMPQAIQSQRTMTVLKASVGRAIRFPTVEELYGATSTTNSQFINDPNLRPEKSWTSELSAEQDVGHGTLRGTLFTENTRDALYSQTIADPVANKNISRVQNIGRIETRGAEIAFSSTDVVARGLDLSNGVTYTDSIIKANVGFVVTPGDTLGK